jgi:hypothetical protein
VISIGTATPLYKDFYQTIRKKRTDDHSSLNFVCIATVVVGLHPIPLAIYVPDVLKAEQGRGGQHPHLSGGDNWLVLGRRCLRHR